MHETRDSNCTSSRIYLPIDRSGKRSVIFDIDGSACDDRSATLIFMTDRSGSIIINRPNVLIHRLPIALVIVRDIYILILPCEQILPRELYVRSCWVSVSPDGGTVRRVSSWRTKDSSRGSHRVSSLCYVVVNSRLVLVTPFVFRASRPSFLPR